MVQGRVAVEVAGVWVRGVRGIGEEGSDQGCGVLGLAREGQGIELAGVGHGDAAGEGIHKEFADFDVPVARGEHERGVVLGIAADFARKRLAFVAGVDEEVDDGEQAVGGGEVEGGVALVVEVRVGEEVWMVAEDALDEQDVVEKDGAAEARAGVDPKWWLDERGGVKW